MQKKHTFKRAVLWFICLYHVAAGLLMIASQDGATMVAENLMGWNIDIDSSLFYLLNPLGAYVLVFGIAMGVAAWDPEKNRAIISIGVILFILRILQRIIFAGAMQEQFDVTPARNWITIGIVAFFGIMLALLRYQLYKEMHDNKPKPA